MTDSDPQSPSEIVDEQLSEQCMQELFFQAISDVDSRTVKDMMVFHRSTRSLDVDKGLCESAKYGNIQLVTHILGARPAPDLR
jgi:hypothetical protein